MKSSIILTLICSLLLAGCNSEPTLQRYFVDNTENKDFIALDVSPTILNVNQQHLTSEQKKSLEAFDKVNILAFKLNDSNKSQFESERDKVVKILKTEKYQELMKFGKGKEGGSLSFVGDENSIEEFVLFANKKESGFAVVRILGKDMNPTDVMNMMSVLQKSNVDMEQLRPFQEMLGKP